MNNPIETNAFTFWLKFISLGQLFEYQITEPYGFDSSNFVVNQNDERYSRDIVYGSENQNLIFYKCNGFEKQNIEQVTNPLGETSFYLDMGFNWILETWNQFGFEGEIEFTLKKDGLNFTVGLLDMAEPDTDETTYFGFKVIQNNQISDYKKHGTTVLDMFGTKNVKNETINPAKPVKILRKATSFEKKSSWVLPKLVNIFTRDLYNYFIFSDKILLNEINQTLSSTLSNGSISNWKNNSTNIEDIAQQNCLFLKAQKTFTNLNININLDGLFKYRPNGFNIYVKLILKYRIWTEPYNFTSGNILINQSLPTGYIININGSNDLDINFNNLINFVIPTLNVGENLSVYYEIIQKVPPGGSIVDLNHELIFYRNDIITTIIETGINTVIKAVRYVDMMEQCSKNINNLPINALKWRLGGEFYNQFLFNRSLISQDTTRPFNTNFEEILESVKEVNGDYEIKDNEIFVGQMPKYYENIEIGVFKIIPSKDFKTIWNSRFLINNFEFGYDTFEEDRDSKNTQQDIHTESKYIIPIKNGENTKSIKNKLIRSAYSQEAVFQLETSKPLTADENDDKVYIIDCDDLPENSGQTIKGVFYVETIDGNYRILNRESTQNEDQALLNWKTLGFEVGDVINLNNQNFAVLLIDRQYLTLQGNGGSVANNYPVTIIYKYNGVLLQTRTNQGFSKIEGIINPSTYPNLRFSIARNLKYWYSYLNSCVNFVENAVIQNNYFKNNTKLVTRFGSEIIDLIEKYDLEKSELTDKILGNKLYELNVYAKFNDVLELLERMKTKRGFVRCLGVNGKIIKGFIQKLDYSWKNEKLSLTLEEKLEPLILKVDFVNNKLLVDNAIYQLSGVSNWYRVTKDYIQLFDINSVAICNPYRFNNVKLNGVVYNSNNDLINAINLLN